MTAMDLSKLVGRIVFPGAKVLAHTPANTRVVRGPDWDTHWNEDGGPEKQGVITKLNRHEGLAQVKWDEGQDEKWYHAGLQQVYHLAVSRHSSSRSLFSC